MDSNSDSLFSDEENDHLARDLFMKRFQNKERVNLTPQEALIRFLSGRKDYVIIGGRAAEYYLEGKVASSDFDIMVLKRDAKAFLDELQTALKPANANWNNMKSKELTDSIYLYTITFDVKGKTHDFVDVQVLQDTKLPMKVVSSTPTPKHHSFLHTSALRFPDKAWLCKELDLTIRNRSSVGYEFKLMKQMARYHALRCGLDNIA